MAHVVLPAVLTGMCLGYFGSATSVAPEWTSGDRRCRILLTVDPRGKRRSHSPTAPVRINFQQELAKQGIAGIFDEHTIEVIAYNASGKPVVFGASRAGYERYLLPWRIDRYYGIDEVDLVFVMPDHTRTLYAVYFDTAESGVGQPARYPGLVGDGDRFTEGYKRREVAACNKDAFCDFDGDGDLDLFKGGVEPFVYCYENVGGNRFEDRGRLSSGGTLFVLPRSRDNRSWVTVAFCDWDADGDQDFIPSFTDGPYAGQIVYYENTTEPTGPLTFAERGPLYGGPRESRKSLGGPFFACPTFVDFDGDGMTDILVARNNRLHFHRNRGRDGAGRIRLAEGVLVEANSRPIEFDTPRADCADVDGDGDLDLFVATKPGPVYLFKNVDTTNPRTHPTFAEGRIIAYDEDYLIADAHTGVKVADFTGDGRLDFVVGRFWERMDLNDPAGPRDYGRLYENVGTTTSPAFEVRGAYSGGPYTEGFQICDAIRQNCVRAVDWDNDGRTDLIAGDTDGFIWYFRNQTNVLSPVFATGAKLRLANGELLSLARSGGHARPDVCDWNNDGKQDLVVADGNGWLTWFENVGIDGMPVLAPGKRIQAEGSPIDRGPRSSVMVCDWNNDGKKDVVFADAADGYVFFENTGGDANPVLAAPKSLGLAMYTRPNLGSFVDWDGDGRKDLIGCNFENNIRLYRNVGSGDVGALPRFASAEGTFLVKPFTVMMTSGADAVDFNGDGDLDILTGQGHAASGLRFYERDYIEDCLDDAHPMVTIKGRSERP